MQERRFVPSEQLNPIPSRFKKKSKKSKMFGILGLVGTVGLGVLTTATPLLPAKYAVPAIMATGILSSITERVQGGKSKEN